jgi:hypothetical protein
MHVLSCVSNLRGLGRRATMLQNRGQARALILDEFSWLTCWAIWIELCYTGTLHLGRISSSAALRCLASEIE